MADLLAAGEAWLAETFTASVSSPAVYRRGALAVTVSLTYGGLATVPLGNAPLPAGVRHGYLPSDELVLGGQLTSPAAGDLIAWTDAAPRVLTLGPWGPDRAAGRRVESGLTWEVYGQEAGGLSGRKTTTVTLERPTASPLRNSYGETIGDRFDDVETMKAEVTPLAAAEDVTAGKLYELSKYLVFVTTTRAVASSWRVRVRDGVLKNKYLYVESVTPLPGFANELMLVCRLAGA